MKTEKFEANQILTLIHFNWIKKGSGLSQSDLIFMHLSIVSRTVGRADDPREIDPAKSFLGQKIDRQLYPASGKIDNPSLTLMTHFLTTQYVSVCLCIKTPVIRKV